MQSRIAALESECIALKAELASKAALVAQLEAASKQRLAEVEEKTRAMDALNKRLLALTAGHTEQNLGAPHRLLPPSACQCALHVDHAPSGATLAVRFACASVTASADAVCGTSCPCLSISAQGRLVSVVSLGSLLGTICSHCCIRPGVHRFTCMHEANHPW